MIKLFIDNIENQLPAKLQAALIWVGMDKSLAKKTVFIKPNLTYPKYKPGVTTSPQTLENLIVKLNDLGCRIIVGESDGGYNSYEVKDAYHDFGLYNLEGKYGIKIVNLSKLPFEYLSIHKYHREFKVEIPTILTKEIDAFITLPVPKVHAMTKISLSYKNQWGCVPNVMRLRYHPIFNEAIFAVNQAIKNKYTIIDGTYGLTRSGPMVGDSFPLGWLMASNSLEAADLIAAKLMGYDLRKINHYKLAYKNKLVPSEKEIEFNQAYQGFKSDKFYLKRDHWSYLALLAWQHPAINYTFYESGISDILHKIMYTFRKRPISD